jgi:hypothetical protein
MHALSYTASPMAINDTAERMRLYYQTTINSLADDILTSIPQLLGLVDSTGQMIKSETFSRRQIGSYFTIFALQLVGSLLKLYFPQRRSLLDLFLERLFRIQRS